MRTFKYSRFAVAVLVAVFTISLSNCVAHVGTRSHKRLPPGQAKKVTGEKSAKRYAPGQNR